MTCNMSRIICVAENVAIQEVQRRGMKQSAMLNREEQYEQGLQKYDLLIKLQEQLGLTSADDKFYLTE